MRAPLTEEMLRILRAVHDGTFSENEHGRYVIIGGARPDRKSREKLRGRGLIRSQYVSGGRWTWHLTARGLAALKDSRCGTPDDGSAVVPESGSVPGAGLVGRGHP